MENIENLPAEPTPEKSEFDLKAEAAILALESSCLALGAESIIETAEFASLLNSHLETIQKLADKRLGHDASVWLNYYTVQTFGYLLENFPEFGEEFDSAYVNLSCAIESLHDDELRQLWEAKVAAMMGN